MAALHVYAHFKDTPKPDDLCPTCFNPSLKTYTLERIDMSGITIVGTRTACTDCKTWTTELEKVA